MYYNYADILELSLDPPLWYDQYGCPRFKLFEPNLTPDIYANTTILARIECQHCGEQFIVQMHSSIFDYRFNLHPHKWHYGDPPIHNCIGDTENCIDIEILEVWHKHDFDWQRHSEYEGVIDGD